jgi:hypothetical protein
VDDDRFDRVARAFGRRTTRRPAAGAAAILAGLAGVLREPPPAEGAGSGFCRGLEPDRYISKHRCTITGCGTAVGCVCVQTPGHRVRCAARFDPATDCPAGDECSGRRPCGRGRFCAKVAKCCGDRLRRVCLRPCPA